MRIVTASKGADVVVGAGDFANARHGLSVCIDVLKAIEIPAVLVPGNNESHDELLNACRGWKNASVLHGAGIEIQRQAFYGIGGGIPITPFGDWSFDFSEEQATELLRGCPRGAVLISHSPPKGFVDQSSAGRSLGSTAVLDAVVELQPRLVVCGHIHASAGERAKVGETLIVNAGPDGVMIELSRGL